jgi:hypothetical protein
MECLIPGLILVGLMIYASTRIKRASAGAYAPETIESEAFVFEKADEFLNKVEPAKGLEVEGYSREYGSGDAANIRQATYEVDRIAGGLDAAADAMSALGEDATHTSEIFAEKKYRVVEIRREEKGIEFIDTYKMAETADGVVRLKVTMLDEASDEVRRRVETILSGFVVK